MDITPSIDHRMIRIVFRILAQFWPGGHIGHTHGADAEQFELISSARTTQPGWSRKGPGKVAQLSTSSLDALYSQFMAAPDSTRLVTESLPRLRGILRWEGQDVDLYEKTLRLLLEIVKQSPHSAIIKSGIVVDLVRWLRQVRSSVDISYIIDGPCSPRHSFSNDKCRKCVFDICQLIAQESDDGRQALVDADILPELSHLASSEKFSEFVTACKILKALAHTGTFRNTIITAGFGKIMRDIRRYYFSAFTSLTISDVIR